MGTNSHEYDLNYLNFTNLRVLRNNGKFEDVGDFNDFYIQPSRDMKSSARKELQELQDQVESILSN